MRKVLSAFLVIIMCFITITSTAFPSDLTSSNEPESLLAPLVKTPDPIDSLEHLIDCIKDLPESSFTGKNAAHHKKLLINELDKITKHIENGNYFYTINKLSFDIRKKIHNLHKCKSTATNIRIS